MNDSIRQSILTAWQSMPQTIRRAPTSEQDLADFEAVFGPIPENFRWFLAECGGGVVGSEWVDDIKALWGTHQRFAEESRAGGWTMTNMFVIGWDGGGNPFGIERGSGRVVVEDHDFGGVHEMAESFESFLARGLRLRNPSTLEG